MATKPGLRNRNTGGYKTLDLLDQLGEESKQREGREQQRQYRQYQDRLRQYGQFQAEQNAEIASSIKMASPLEIANRAQQERIEERKRAANTGSNVLTPEMEAEYQRRKGGGNSLSPYQAFMQAQMAQLPKAPAAAETRSTDELRRDMNRKNRIASGTERMAADMSQGIQNRLYDPTYTTNLQSIQRRAEASRASADRATDLYQTLSMQRRLEEEQARVAELMKNPDFREKSQGKPEIANSGTVSATGSNSAARLYRDIYYRGMTGADGKSSTDSAARNVTDEEAAVFFYIWNTQGARAAESYYKDYVENRASQRQMETIQRQAQAYGEYDPIGASIRSVGTNLMSGVGLIDMAWQNLARTVGLTDKNKPLNYYSAAQSFGLKTDAYRQGASDFFEQLAVDELKRSAPEIKNPEKYAKVASFLYQTGMSMADSGVSALLTSIGVPEPLTLANMGAAAGTRAIRDAKERGATDGQALAFGVSSAIMEALFEKISMDKILEPSYADTFKAHLWNAVSQSFTEGSEEVMTTLANTAMDQLIMGDKSELFARQRELMEQGVGEKEALGAAFKQWGTEVLGDFLGGLVSGFGMGGIKEAGYAVGALRNNADNALLSVDLQNMANAAQAEARLRQQYEQQQQNVPQPQPLTIPSQETVSARQADPLGYAMNKAQGGETVTKSDARAIIEDPQALQALRDTGALTGKVANDSEGRQKVIDAVSSLAEQRAQESSMPAAEAQQTAATEAERAANPYDDLLSQIWGEQAQERTAPTTATETNTETNDPAWDRIVADLEAQRARAAEQRAQERTQREEEVSTPPVPKAQETASEAPTEGRLRLPEQKQRQETPPVPRLTVRSENATLNENRQEVTNGQAETAAPAETADERRARNETAAFRRAANDAAGGADLDRAEWRAGLGRLLQAVRNSRDAGARQQRRSEAARITNQAEAGDPERLSAKELGVADGTDAKTAVRVDDKILGTQWQQTVADYAKRGIKLTAISGQLQLNKRNAGGAYQQARAYISADGKTIVVQADNPRLSWQQLLAHEELHRLIKENPNYRKSVMDALLADKKVRPYLSQIIDRYAEAYHEVAPSATDEGIIEELLADYRAGFDMLDPLGTNRTLAKVTRAAAKDIRAVEKKGTNSHGQPIQYSSDGTKATVDGVAIASNIADTITEDPRPFDYMSADKQSIETFPDWAANYAKKGGENAEQVIDAIRRFTEDMIASDVIMDYVPVGSAAYNKTGPLRKNIEYVFSFDMDASCPRTFQFLNYRNELQRIAGRPLTYAESIQLIELMRAYGQQIPCSYCYVENKRVLLANNYLNWFDFYDRVVGAETDEEARKLMYGYNEKKDSLSDGAEKELARWRKEDKNYRPKASEVWLARQTAKNSVFNWLDQRNEAGLLSRKTGKTKIVEAVCKQFNVTDKAAKAEIRDFVDNWVYDRDMKIPHNYEVVNDTDVSEVDQRALNMHRTAMAYANSASSARTVDNYAPYTDQIWNVTPEQKRRIMAQGGIRKHSSNDFRMDYVQDYFLFFADLAAGGWTGHTYTKNVDYVKIFGRTGDRINVSVAFSEDNGQVRENMQEGMGWKDAQQLRKDYSENVGVMAMVTSDAQLSYALNSDWIDMIIPFHASGLDKSVWYNIRMWQDYTSKQNERWYNSERMRQELLDAGVTADEITEATTVTKEEKDAGLTAAKKLTELYRNKLGIKLITNKDGLPIKPHFLPGSYEVNGQTVPGHNNDKETYFKLCKEYGVTPRFQGILVDDGEGNMIDVTEHKNYMKLVKETARADVEQKPIQFNFDQVDPALGMTPFEYAMQRMQEEARNGGYANTAEDQYGIVDEFRREYLGKNVPLPTGLDEKGKPLPSNLDDMLSERALAFRESLLEMQREAQEKQDAIVEESAVDGKASTDGGKFSLEVRPEVVQRLDQQLKDGNYVIVYHSMYRDKDGNLYSPMAGKKKVGNEWVMTDPYDLNAWYKSDTPENIADLIENGSVRLKDNGKWSFILKKPDKSGDVPAALNPWNHASTDALNDQFSSAYERENDEGELVTVECVIPLSEVDQSVAVDPITGKIETQPYEEKGMITDRDVEAKPDPQNKKLKVSTPIPAGTTIEAKDSVGLKMWKAGAVHRQISGKRPVYLSRWIRNTRVLSTEETARMIAKTLRDEGFTGEIPGNTVGLKLRKALEDEGFKFGKPESSVAKGYYAYMEKQGYTREQANGAKLGGSASIEIDPEVAAQFSPEALALREETKGRRRNPFRERKVSRVRSNTYENSGLFDEVEAQMDEADPSNYEYDPISEKRSMNEARKRLKDFDGEVAKLSQPDYDWGGSDLDTAMGILHRYRTEGRATGDYTDFWNWSKTIQKKGTKGGQFIQAFAKYTRTGTGTAAKAAATIHEQNQLTPAQRKQVQGHVERLLNGMTGEAQGAAGDAMQQAKGKKEPTRKQTGKVDKKRLEAETRRRKDAERLVREIYRLFEQANRPNHGAPVENWLNLTGEQLAKRIASRFNEPTNPQRTTMQTILGDLMGFAREHALPERQRTEGGRTAIDTITDYLNNRDAYGAAWAQAQSVLRAQYANDPEKLEALEGFLGATITYNAEGTDRTMLDAILQSADVLGISEKRILELTSVGEMDNTIRRIGDELVSQVQERMGADWQEEFGQSLRDAVRRHINGIALAEGGAKQALRLRGLETEAARKLDIDLQKILTESRLTKQDAARQVADYLIDKLGIPSSDAAIAAQRISESFMDELAARADRRLQQMFGEKTTKAREQRDKLLDLLRLGGFTNANVEDAVVDALGIGKLSREEQKRITGDMARFGETLDAMMDDDLDGLRQLIREQAAVRNTPLSRQAEKTLAGETDAEYLRDFAMAQLASIAGDYAELSPGAKISTFQTISHLLNARTALRNLTSNQVFDLVDSAANNVALIPDMVIGAITGKRTVGANKSWFSDMKRSGAIQGLRRNALEVRLDVAPDERQKSKYGTAGRRTNSMANSNAFGRILSHLEEIMGYELNSTDEFHKGSVRGETLESLARLVERGDITQEQANAWAEEEALYRSFQDDTLVGNIMGELKTLLNVIGFGDSGKKNSRGRTIHDFGLGDLVVKYTQVPGALIHRGIEYSPLGYAKMLYDLAIAKDSLVRTQKRGEDVANAQRKLALDIGRATTGSGLITLFAVLAKAGLLRRDDDDKDKNAKALHAAQGLSGTQLNLTALGRWISGEDAEPQDGDVLADIGFLEPLDSLMTIATLLAKDKDLTATDVGVKSLDGVWKAISNTSAMQTISNIIQTVQYHDEENDLPLYFQIPIEIASDSVSGFIPSPVRQLAQATDTTYRDQYRSQNINDQIRAKVANSIPGLRQTLAPKITPLGEEKKYQKPILNYLNATLNPGNISVYQASDVVDELNRVYAATDDAKIWPERNAPYSFTANKESWTLTPDERTQFQRTRGQTTAKFIEDLMAADWYKKASADDQAKWLNWIGNFSSYVAKKEMLEARDVEYASDTYEKYYKAWTDGASPADVVKESDAKSIALSEAGFSQEMKDEVKDMNRQDFRDYLQGQDLTDEEKLTALGAIIGTEMTTKEGNPSQWANVNTAVQDGNSVDTVLGWVQNDLLDDYMKYRNGDVKKAKVDVDTYMTYRVDTGKMDAKDETGKTVSGLKKQRVVTYIDGLDLTPAQKDALYYDAGYSESGLKDTPWHKGGGSGSGQYARANLPTLRLPTAPTVAKPRSGLRIRGAQTTSAAPRSGLRIRAK